MTRKEKMIELIDKYGADGVLRLPDRRVINKENFTTIYCASILEKKLRFCFDAGDERCKSCWNKPITIPDLEILSNLGLKKEFSISDIKAGYLVEMEKGLCIAIPTKGSVTRFFNSKFEEISDTRNYSVNLKSTQDELTINKVWGLGEAGFSLFSDFRRDLLFERKTYVKMTPSEISKKLGIKNLIIVNEE